MIYFAKISQETDTFNPRPTTVADFERQMLAQGADVLTRGGDHPTVKGWMAELRADGAASDVRPVISAYASAGGRISAEGLEYFRARLAAGIRGARAGDTIFLSLHGAFAAAGCDSADSDLLEALRRETGRGPVVVLSLDHHANITREIVQHADLIVGHETQPHDMEGTARKCVRIWRRVMSEGIRPATAWRKIPMIAPQDQFLTTKPGAMKDWFDHARRWEQDPRVLAVSPFPMQPWLDVAQGGWAVVVHTTGDAALADQIADESAELVWGRRADFWVSERVSAAEAVRVDRQDRLTVISDTGDAVLGGGCGDSTVLLREIVEQRIEQVIYLPLVDPAAVAAAHRAGEGAQMTLRVGGQIGTAYYAPVEITATVRKLTEGFETMGLRLALQVGRAALLEVCGARVALLEAASGAMVAPGLYEGLGLRMTEADAVVVKTGSNWQAFAPWQKRLVRADTAGVTQSRLQDFTWTRLPRPIYPFDKITHWR